MDTRDIVKAEWIGLDQLGRGGWFCDWMTERIALSLMEYKRA